MTEACNYYSISVTAPILTRCHNRAANYYRPCCCESRARMQHCGHTFAFPFPVRVCCCVVEPVEKKELRRGGSQLKRISAPAVRSRRAIFESPHHLDILNATPFPLHRSASPLSTRTRSIRASYSHPSVRQRNLPSLFHAEESVHRSTKEREGVYCLLETRLSSRYSR